MAAAVKKRAAAKKDRRPKRKPCSFCAEKRNAINYKEVGRLRKYVSERGKIVPRRISGQLCEASADHNGLRQAGTRDRFLAVRRGVAGCALSFCRILRPLGAAGTVVDVADGYARNYLLPRKWPRKRRRAPSR